MVLGTHARSATQRALLPVVRGLVRLGVSADALTAFGLIGTVAGMTLVLAGMPTTGAVVAAVSALVDALDGQVARYRGTATAYGSFADSVADRLSDAFVFGVVAWLVRDDPLLFSLAIVAAAAAQITSYVRAKAEALGWSAAAGIVERPERLLIVLVGIGFGWLPVALWLLAVGGVVTVVQRCRVVRVQAGRG